MKVRYRSRRRRHDVFFPLVTFAVCNWPGWSHDTFSASGGSLIRSQSRAPVSQDRKRGGSSSGRDSWNSGFSVVFPRGMSVYPPTHWCLSPSLTPPRGKRILNGAGGFQSSSCRFVNPYLISRGNRRAINQHVQSHGFQLHRVTKPTWRPALALCTRPPALHRRFSPASFSEGLRDSPCHGPQLPGCSHRSFPQALGGPEMGRGRYRKAVKRCYSDLQDRHSEARLHKLNKQGNASCDNTIK